MNRYLYCALLFCGVVCQAQPAFDAASIKPTPPERPEFPYRVGPNSLSVRAQLKSLIMLAYQVQYYQVAGIPSWAESAWFDVQARADGDAD